MFSLVLQPSKSKEVLIKSGMQIAQTDFSSGGCRPPGLYENDAGILDVFQGVLVQNGGKYASKMRAAIYSALP